MKQECTEYLTTFKLKDLTKYKIKQIYSKAKKYLN